MKWKLVKLYPGFDKLGVIASDEQIKNPDHLGIRHDVGIYTLYPKNLVMDYPEFWEEVKEKEYTILSFIAKDGSIFEDKGHGAFVSKMLTKPVITKEIGIKSYSINSVRRESDGEVFTLGDKIVSMKESYKQINVTIKNFELNKVADGGMYLVDIIEGIALNVAQKAPIRKPILITEDGVELFGGEEYYFVDSILEHSFGKFTPIKDVLGDITPGKTKGRCRFSTKEKAEEYIKWNKPLYSLKEIEEAVMDNDGILGRLEKLGKK